MLLWKPRLLRPRHGRKPTFTHYLLISVAYAAFVGQPLALLGHGDLVANLALNSFLWMGSFAGVFLAWWILLRRYRFGMSTIVACAGLLGWLEPGLLVVRLAAAGGWQILIIAPVLHAVYAALVAPSVNAYREAFSAEGKAPRASAIALGAILPAAGFWIGMLWIALMRLLLRAAIGA